MLMTSTVKKETGRALDVFTRFDRMFEDWMRTAPWRPAAEAAGWPHTETIKVDQFRDGDALVVRAELAGIDPDRDVELTVADGMLNIEAERRVQQKSEDKGYVRHELHYGSFVRRLPLPDGVTETDVSATYRDGILEVRVPIPEKVKPAEPTKIAIKKG